MKNALSLFLLFSALSAQAQLPDHVYNEDIHGVKLFKYGDIYSYPVIKLNGGDQLELHFDDMGGGVKNYYYSYQLCNADWTPSLLQSFDYIRGFQSTRITTYRNSSLVNTRYMHYQAVIPDRSSTPIRSGNYLLKVFLNNDTSQLLFTKRFLVVESKVAVAAQMLSPFNVQLTRTDQRVHVAVSTVNSQINVMSPQDLKLVVLQNNIWPSAAIVNRPTIYRGNYYEYNDDATTFPAGREWRWVDLRSVRLMSDRVQKIIDTSKQVDVYVKPDGERRGQIYVYYRDLNGVYTIENSDGNNPFWQSEYSYVHFTFVPPARQAYPGKDIYLFGELTNYAMDDASRMVFNQDKGVYEGTLFLKQGYYNYSYVSVDAKDKTPGRFSFASTEGDFNTTENNYTVLVYYRAFGARADELIGFAQLNSIVLR
ncbi:MAG: DUF5103 domain-containing protein [Chitinophagaceae bacterium]|nr:DUF5103 domain-containing protein [Chitinophagaceae bacterium]